MSATGALQDAPAPSYEPRTSRNAGSHVRHELGGLFRRSDDKTPRVSRRDSGIPREAGGSSKRNQTGTRRPHAKRLPGVGSSPFSTTTSTQDSLQVSLKAGIRYYKRLADLNEEIAVEFEDTAESEALAASKPFARLVDRELKKVLPTESVDCRNVRSCAPKHSSAASGDSLAGIPTFPTRSRKHFRGMPSTDRRRCATGNRA